MGEGSPPSEELFIEEIPTAQDPRDPWKHVGRTKSGSKFGAGSGNVERLVIERVNLKTRESGMGLSLVLEDDSIGGCDGRESNE